MRRLVPGLWKHCHEEMVEMLKAATPRPNPLPQSRGLDVDVRPVEVSWRGDYRRVSATTLMMIRDFVCYKVGSSLSLYRW